MAQPLPKRIGGVGSKKKVKFIPLGVMGAIPGMSAVATRMMKEIVRDIRAG